MQKKVKNILLSSLLFISCTTTATILTSCKHIETQQQTQSIIVVPDELSDSSKKFILNFSADEWMDKLISNSDTDVANLIEIINQNNDKTFKQKNCYFLNFKKLYNTGNIVKTTLTCMLSYNNINYELILKNLFTFSSKYFYPPKQNNLSFSQTNMDTIRNKPYEEVQDYEWIEAINNLYFQNYPTSKEFPIPPSLYFLRQKKYNRIDNSCVLTYSINPEYKEQIAILPNNMSYVDINVKITDLVVK